MKQDPWVHRSKGMQCRTCMWFVPKGEGPLGRCRRHAPTMSGYPAVFLSDWCGDHKLDEEQFGPLVQNINCREEREMGCHSPKAPAPKKPKK